MRSQRTPSAIWGTDAERMSRKSGRRFSGKDMRNCENLLLGRARLPGGKRRPMVASAGRLGREHAMPSIRAAVLLAAVFLSETAAAQGDFYAGRQIDMFIGTPTGGGYDQYGRLLGRHMSRYIP